MNHWLSYLLPRNWAKLARAVFGDFNYKPPQWVVAMRWPPTSMTLAARPKPESWI